MAESLTNKAPEVSSKLMENLLWGYVKGNEFRSSVVRIPI